MGEIEQMHPELGIIEGFYGKPWTWEARQETISFLAPYGYRFYLYAPKADPFLRRRWQEPHPDGIAARIADLAAHARDTGVRFGVGLSPFELFNNFDEPAREALARKLSFFDAVGTEDLAILFDDMRGDVPDLAEKQAEIVDWASARTKATRIIVCPSYYSDDPILDRVFGHRPEGYIEQLGALLDSSIEIFWTGEEVISRQYSPAHLARVAEEMRRKPFLWDNYPVNDGQRMSQYLHLRGFTGRPARNAAHIAAHGINPALQPTLNRIPAITLSESYRLGDDYQYAEAFRHACVTVLGEELGMRLREDLLTLQDIGLDRLGEKEKLLRERYEGAEHEGAREVIAWLNGSYRITDEIVQTQ
ncbi:MAG TPA: beta-N-acetylglucosaminidase domain-containing protein [Gemmatimonadaceae bacterium]|nr:beta-N-acetylglucosaminidase domain-containing protein [Gemmatimonadaceae bacterium]